MPLKTLVKVGNITNLSDARYCAGMGVEMLGFDAVAGSLNYIEQQKYQEIRGWVSGPAVVAQVYGLSTKEALIAVIENYVPDYLELTVNEITVLGELTLSLILRIDESSYNKHLAMIDTIRSTIKYVIINQDNSSPAFIESVSKSFDVLMEPSVDADINHALESFPIKGLSLSGSQEIKPGLKDYDHLSNVLEVLDAD